MEQFTSEIRLGDVIDDHCIKCRRVTNHSIVSLVDGKAAKVRCRTCYHDHDYRNEQAPPTKKELLQQALFKEVLSSVAPSEDGSFEPSAEEALVQEKEPVGSEEAGEQTGIVPEAPPEKPAKKTKTRGKRA